MKRISHLRTRFFTTLVAATWLLTTLPAAHAFWPRLNTRLAPITKPPVAARRPAPSYHDTYHYLNSRYPKYYGGFHSRYFPDMGIPPGDIGLRGNGIFMAPW